MTILLADDDPFLRELLSSALRSHGYQVLEAETGDHALPLLHQRRFEVVVTDIVMPGELDGWSLSEQARRDRGGLFEQPASATRAAGEPKPVSQKALPPGCGRQRDSSTDLTAQGQ